MGFQQRPGHFENSPNQLTPMRVEGQLRFESPIQPGPRFDVPHQSGLPRFDCPPGQQGPPRFVPQHNLQPPMRPMAPPIYDNALPAQQNFGMALQGFPETLTPQFHGGPMTFQAQPAGFNMQPAPPFNQSAAAPFYNPAAPAVSMQQPVSSDTQTCQIYLTFLIFKVN